LSSTAWKRDSRARAIKTCANKLIAGAENRFSRTPKAYTRTPSQRLRLKQKNGDCGFLKPLGVDLEWRNEDRSSL